MGSCLGIYIGDKTLKYAKLIQDEKTRGINLESCGSKYIVGNKDHAISEIIIQTGSTDVPVCLNLTDYFRASTEVLKQLSKSDVQSVLNLEVADMATTRGLNDKAVEYRYIFMNSSVSNDNYTADVAVVEKKVLEKLQEDKKFSKIVGVYPQEYIINDLIKNDMNHLIINVDEKTQILNIANGKIRKITDIDIGMKTILDTIAEQEGSYSRACDICKSINVLSDDESLTPELERVIEPAIQDLLNRIKMKIEESKLPCDRIYLTGLVNLFINIEVLFEQFFGITTEKLKPQFLEYGEDANIPEIIEANDAIALAYQGLNTPNSSLNFLDDKASKNPFGQLFNKAAATKGQSKHLKKTFVMPTISVEKIESALLFANLTAGVVLAGYVGFSTIYNSKMTSIQEELKAKIDSLQTQTADIKSDKKYIDNSTEEYKDFNNYIKDIVAKIKEGKIGEYSTYNVANFMQKIAKYIPSNVELESISSNNNKTVTIEAKSTSYAELGYFISQLKLKGILNNIKTGKVNTGNYITVTIGGDLP